MKNLLLLLLGLFSISSHAATPSGVPQVNFGYGVNTAVAAKSVPYTSLTNTFALVAESASGTNTHYYKFVKLAALSASNAQYQVTAGKTAYCSGFYVAAGSLVEAGFGYGTAALGAEDTVTAPTGAVQLFGSTLGMTLLGGTANVASWFPIPVQFPGSDYPYLYLSAGSAVNFTITLICEEQ